MPRRLLNIASIVCLVLCVALMGMWVRSYYYRYSLEMRFDSRLLQFVLDRGLLTYWDMHPITTKADVTAMLDDMSQHEVFVSSTVDPRGLALSWNCAGLWIGAEPGALMRPCPIGS